MAEFRRLPSKNLIMENDLIFECTFSNGELDFLQCVKRLEKLSNPQDVETYKAMMKAQGIEERYHISIFRAVNNLLSFFNDLTPRFVPDAIVRPPSKKPHLQQPLFQESCNLLPDADDLSEFLVKDSEEFPKYRLRENAPKFLSYKERILIIDDVYATGSTVDSIKQLLGDKKSYLTICPLLVEQKDKRLEECIEVNLKRVNSEQN